jgi:hypothetical protein
VRADAVDDGAERDGPGDHVGNRRQLWVRREEVGDGGHARARTKYHVEN